MNAENQLPLPTPAVTANDDHTWALVLHLSALLHLFGPSFPGVNIVGPLIIWLWKKPGSPYLDEVGKRVLNFQISWAIYFGILWLITGLLIVILVGFLLLPVIGIVFLVWLVITIIGAIKQSNREPYDFPLTIQFLK